MNTLLALLILFGMLTFGLIAVAGVMMVMGLAGMPGALIGFAGDRAKSSILASFGFLVTALGQSFVVGAYIVFIVSLLRWFAEGRPDVPTWPLWIAAFIHSEAAPAYGMKERPQVVTTQHSSLGLVSLIATVIFFITAFSPATLSPIYKWVPFYSTQMLSSSPSNNNKSNDTSKLTINKQMSVEGFFNGYKAFQDMQVLVKEIPNSDNPAEDFQHLNTLIALAIDRLTECDIDLMNDILSGWGNVTKEKFIPGLEKLKAGINEGNDADLARADALLASFDDWLHKNWKELGKKVGDS